MTSPYDIKVQKTFLGRSGGGWVNRAKVQQMRSEDFIVFIPELLCEAILSYDGDLVLSDVYGIYTVALTLSEHALEKLQKLEAEAEKKMMEKNQEEEL